MNTLPETESRLFPLELDTPIPSNLVKCPVYLLGSSSGLDWDESALHNLGRELARRGWPVRYIARQSLSPEASTHFPFPVMSFPTGDQDPLLSLVQFVSTLEPGLLVVSREWNLYALAPYFPAHIAFIPLISEDKATFYYQAIGASTAASAFLCCSSLIQRTLAALNPSIASRCFLFPTQANTSFPASPRPAKKTDDPLRLLCFGPFEPGQSRVLDAPHLVAELQSQQCPFTLDLIGNGSAKLDLIARMNAAILDGQVHFLMSFDHERTQQILHAHDALIQFSELEPGSQNVLDAMSSGVVPILADYGHLHSCFETGNNCLTFPMGDIAAAREAVHSLQSNPELLSRIAIGAQQTAARMKPLHELEINVVDAHLQQLSNALLDKKPLEPAVIRRTEVNPQQEFHHPLRQISELELTQRNNIFRKLTFPALRRQIGKPRGETTRLPLTDNVRQRVQPLWDRRPDWIRGGIRVDDAFFLDVLIENRRPECFYEVGVASGLSSAIILQSFSRFADRNRVWLHSYDLVKTCFFDNSKKIGEVVPVMVPDLVPNWRLHLETTVLDVPHKLPNQGQALYFIDAMHSHPWPVLDLIALLPGLTPGDCVILHDINLPKISNNHFPHFGAQWLFDSWTGPRIVPDVPMPNIGAIVIPENLDSILPVLFQTLIRPWNPEILLTDLGLQTYEWRLIHFLRQKSLL